MLGEESQPCDFSLHMQLLVDSNPALLQRLSLGGPPYKLKLAAREGLPHAISRRQRAHCGACGPQIQQILCLQAMTVKPAPIEYITAASLYHLAHFSCFSRHFVCSFIHACIHSMLNVVRMPQVHIYDRTNE